MARRKKGYVVKSSRAVADTTFAHEQPDGTYTLTFFPPGVTVVGETAEQVGARALGGEKVVAYLLNPSGVIADVVPWGAKVAWIARPKAGKPPAGWPVTSS